MRTARARVFIFAVQCPHCEGALIEPNSGSTLFSIHEFSPPSATCDDCGLESKLPQRCYGDLITKCRTNPRLGNSEPVSSTVPVFVNPTDAQTFVTLDGKRFPVQNVHYHVQEPPSQEPHHKNDPEHLKRLAKAYQRGGSNEITPPRYSTLERLVDDLTLGTVMAPNLSPFPLFRAATVGQRIAALVAVEARIISLGHNPSVSLPSTDIPEVLNAMLEMMQDDKKFPDEAAAWLVNETKLTKDGQPMIVFNL